MKRQEKKFTKLKSIVVTIIAYVIGDFVYGADKKWFLYGFILLFIVMFAISLVLTIYGTR